MDPETSFFSIAQAGGFEGPNALYLQAYRLTTHFVCNPKLTKRAIRKHQDILQGFQILAGAGLYAHAGMAYASAVSGIVVIASCRQNNLVFLPRGRKTYFASF